VSGSGRPAPVGGTGDDRDQVDGATVTEPTASPPGQRSLVARYWWVAGIAIAVLVVVVLAPLASSDPDGLERVAEDVGFIGQATNFVDGLLGGYGDSTVSTILSGLLGIAIVVGLLYLLGRVVARRKV
jgi:cobalt/nickel transport protein